MHHQRGIGYDTKSLISPRCIFDLHDLDRSPCPVTTLLHLSHLLPSLVFAMSFRLRIPIPKAQRVKDARARPAIVEAPHAVDQAAIYLALSAVYPPLTPDAEKRLVRKIDWVIIPMVRIL